MVDPNRTPSRQPPDDEPDLDERDPGRSRREPPSVAHDRGEGIRRRHQTDDDPVFEDEDVDSGTGIKFLNTVDSDGTPRALTVIREIPQAGNALSVNEFAGEVGRTSPLRSLVTDVVSYDALGVEVPQIPGAALGETLVNGGYIRTIDVLTFDDPVRLQPVIAAGAIGAIAAAFWLKYNAPVRDRQALGIVGSPVVALILGAALLVAAGLIKALLPLVPATLLLAVVAGLALIWLRRAIHVGLLQESREVVVERSIECPNCGRTTASSPASVRSISSAARTVARAADSIVASESFPAASALERKSKSKSGRGPSGSAQRMSGAIASSTCACVIVEGFSALQ